MRFFDWMKRNLREQPYMSPPWARDSIRIEPDGTFTMGPAERQFWWDAERKFKKACEAQRPTRIEWYDEDKEYEMQGKRYCLHPGPVKSRNDGEYHHISAAMLADLYGVHLRDCIVDGPGYRRDTMARLEHLYPREDGDYRTLAVRQRDDYARKVRLGIPPFPPRSMQSVLSEQFSKPWIFDVEAELNRRVMEEENRKLDELHRKFFGRSAVSEVKLPVQYRSQKMEGIDNLTDQRFTVRVGENEGEIAKEYIVTEHDTIDITTWVDGTAVRGPKIRVSGAYRQAREPMFAISSHAMHVMTQTLADLKTAISEQNYGTVKSRAAIIDDIIKAIRTVGP